MARPSKLTDEMVRQVGKLAEVCLPLETIAGILGVSDRTMRDWRSRGEEAQERENEEPLGEHDERCLCFFRALNEGYAKAEQTIVQGLIACLKDGQYGAGKFLLSTHPMFRKRWKEKEISIEDALKVVGAALSEGREDVARALREIAVIAMQAAKQPSA